jgi:bifunctional DNA-binding transcriptional regulator/antitoxin component of YhaV-PrlF toxin-antitoxin module
MRVNRSNPERREYETHYMYDARITVPSPIRGYAKTEEGARAACVVKVEAERFNKAVIVRRETSEILHVFRRNPATGGIDREDHRYKKLLAGRAK